MRNEKRYTLHILQAVNAYKKSLDDHRGALGDCAHMLSKQYGVTRNTLQEVFKDQYGITIRDYKLNKRMERSRKMLRAGKEIKEISYQLHYTTVRAFLHAFKKHFGVTPSQYTGMKPMM
jgi:AraC-like DNA-binding protein